MVITRGSIDLVDLRDYSVDILFKGDYQQTTNPPVHQSTNLPPPTLNGTRQAFSSFLRSDLGGWTCRMRSSSELLVNPHHSVATAPRRHHDWFIINSKLVDSCNEFVTIVPIILVCHLVYLHCHIKFTVRTIPSIPPTASITFA